MLPMRVIGLRKQVLAWLAGVVLVHPLISDHGNLNRCGLFPCFAIYARIIRARITRICIVFAENNLPIRQKTWGADR